MKKLPLFAALDLDTEKQALSFVKNTKKYIQAYKIGPRLFLHSGKQLIDRIKQLSPEAQIFLDFKFYDIPSSTAEAVYSAFHIGADYVTVHASVGKESLSQLYDLECRLSKEGKFKILFVTVLSSVPSSSKTKNSTLNLAETVYQTGLRGLVCSPWEARLLRDKYPSAFLLTPGIRMEGDSKGDQKRVMTPRQALQAGSSAIVMGRSLITKPNPEKVLEELAKQLGE